MEAEKAQQKEKDMQQAGHQEQPSAGQDDGMCRTTVRLSLATRAEIDRMVHDKYGDAPLRSRIIRELVDLGLQAARAKSATGK
jgi:hypothetical protein